MDDIEHLEYSTQCKIIRTIASGGMGDVFLAEQCGAFGFKKTVAIKTIRSNLLENQNAYNMFISEAKLVADLIHENIAQVYNLCAMDNQVFIVMEFIKGINLSKLIKKHVKIKTYIDADMAAFICSRVARALSYAHNKCNHQGEPLEIVHRDVTPANVLIDTLGVVKLTDFGIAKGITMGTPDEKKVLMGKYPYMSPEQVALKGTDPKSDIFTLGLLFYELLTLKKVYPAKSREELLEMVEHKKIELPHRLNPKIPEPLSEIIMRMLELEPENRTSTARKIVLQLERYMYDKGYGPTNEKLALYLRKTFSRA